MSDSYTYIYTDLYLYYTDKAKAEFLSLPAYKPKPQAPFGALERIFCVRDVKFHGQRY